MVNCHSVVESMGGKIMMIRKIIIAGVPALTMGVWTYLWCEGLWASIELRDLAIRQLTHIRGGANCFVQGTRHDCASITEDNCQNAGGNYCEYRTGEGYVCVGTRSHQPFTKWHDQCPKSTAGKSDCPYYTIHCRYMASCDRAGCEQVGSGVWVCKPATPGGGTGIGPEHRDYRPSGQDEKCE